ncbi:MAG TPA: ABC transporter permease [Oscillospiraceae bacterium]|nr:ABC transporter permease [Oscillospiraceae bacterium]HNW05299.1 ABC transporter permease [Oscillospiraceae bacterium]
MLRSKYPAFPYLLFMVIFIAVPLCMVAYFAFTGADGSFTTANIVGVAAYSSVILRSLWMAFVATVISLLLGYPFAYFMAKRTTHVRRTMLMLIMLPMWMNFLLRTYAWMTILENNGLINRLLRLLGLGTLQLINTQGAVVLGMVYDYLPFMIIPLYTVLIKMDVSVIQAAQDLGGNPVEVFTRVVFPLSVPGITTGVTMVFVPAVSTFIISRMLGGGTDLMIGDLIEMQFLGNTYNPNLGGAIAFVLMVIVLFCMSVMNQFDSNKEEQEEEGIVI